MPSYYPPVGFHFKVEVRDLPANDHDVCFTEVSGLSVEMGVEEVPEGGENHFVQKYPTRPKYPDLVLKRGLLKNSEIWKWIRDCIEHLEITPKDVFVKLLNEEHQPLMTWRLVGAFPTKWSVSDFNASNSAVVIESLQMYYRYFTVDKS
jgi:phage tail-like protein